MRYPSVQCSVFGHRVFSTTQYYLDQMLFVVWGKKPSRWTCEQVAFPIFKPQILNARNRSRETTRSPCDFPRSSSPLVFCNDWEKRAGTLVSDVLLRS